MDIITSLREGNRLALSKVLTHVENNTPTGQQALEMLFPSTGSAYLIGITGAPGTGKSTLVNSLALSLRRQANIPKVAIIAVDPSSPYTGGALLGDRVRMRDLSGDTGIFIRSMASRGALGGLAHTTTAMSQVLDAAGYDIILIETVGAGQSEVEIAGLAHTVIVVEAPGLGDEIQAIKAGILEIADILVVNKSDKPGAENSRRALQAMLEMARGGGYNPPARKHLFQVTEPAAVVEVTDESEWTPPIICTIATENQGMDELLEAIKNHQKYLKKSTLWERRDKENLALELEGLIRDALSEKWATEMPKEVIERTLDEIYQRKIAPHTAVKHLLAYNKART